MQSNITVCSTNQSANHLHHLDDEGGDGGVVAVVVVVLVVGQTVGSISSKTLANDCLYTLELFTASLIATS